MDKLAELLSGLNEIELQRAAELLQQQLKGSITAAVTTNIVTTVDSALNNNNNINDTNNNNNKNTNTEVLVNTTTVIKNNKLEQLQESKGHDEAFANGKDEQDENDIPLFMLHSLHMEEIEEQHEEHHEEKETNEAGTEKEVCTTCINSETTNVLEGDVMCKEHSVNRTNNGYVNTSNNNNNNKENELWQPTRHSKRLQEKAEKEALNNQNNTISHLDSNEKDANITKKRKNTILHSQELTPPSEQTKRSYKRRRFQDTNSLMNNNNNNNNSNNINNKSSNNNRDLHNGKLFPENMEEYYEEEEEEEEEHSASHSPSPQAHFLEMLMGSALFDEHKTGNGSIDPLFALKWSNENETLLQTLSPQSPSPEAPHTENKDLDEEERHEQEECNGKTTAAAEGEDGSFANNDNDNKNKKSASSSKANKSSKAAIMSTKRNKESKEQNAAASNTLSLTAFGFLPTVSHLIATNATTNNNNKNGVSVNGDSMCKKDDNKLFTPFVQDSRIVPAALQFWNWKNNNMYYTEEKEAIIVDKEVMLTKAETIDTDNKNFYNNTTHDVALHEQANEECKIDNIINDNEGNEVAFCLNDPDESSLMHPPVCMQDGKVIFNTNNNNDNDDEEEEEGEEESVKFERCVHKTKTVSKANNTSKFASFDAMIEASNLQDRSNRSASVIKEKTNNVIVENNNDNNNNEWEEKENDKMPSYTIHNMYDHLMAEKEEYYERQQQNRKPEVCHSTNIIKLLSHRCPCSFHSNVTEDTAYKGFDNEVIFCGFYAIGYDPFQARPPYFGTYNHLQNGNLNEMELLQMARLPCTEQMPRLSTLDYEYDSGDDWDILENEEELSNLESERESDSESNWSGESYYSDMSSISEGEQWESSDLGKDALSLVTQASKRDWLHKHKHKHRHGEHHKSKNEGSNDDDDDDDEAMMKGFIVNDENGDDDSDCEIQRNAMEAREKRINRLRKMDKLIPAFSGPFISLAANEHPLTTFDAMEFILDNMSSNTNKQSSMPEFLDNMIKYEVYKFDPCLLLPDELEEINANCKSLRTELHGKSKSKKSKHKLLKSLESTALATLQPHEQNAEQKLTLSTENKENDMKATEEALANELNMEDAKEENVKGKESNSSGNDKKKERNIRENNTERHAKSEEEKEAKRIKKAERQAKLAARLAERAQNKRYQTMNEEEINAMHACVTEHNYRINTHMIIALLLEKGLCSNIPHAEIGRTVKRFYEIRHGMHIRRAEPWAPYDERLFAARKKHKSKGKNDENNNNINDNNDNDNEEETCTDVKNRKSEELTVEELFALSVTHHEHQKQEQEQQKEEDKHVNNNEEAAIKRIEQDNTHEVYGKEENKVLEKIEEQKRIVELVEVQNEEEERTENVNTTCEELQQQQQEQHKRAKVEMENDVCEIISEHSVMQIEDSTDTSTSANNNNHNNSNSKNTTSDSSNSSSSNGVVIFTDKNDISCKRPREEEEESKGEFITIVHTSDSEPQTIIIDENV